MRRWLLLAGAIVGSAGIPAVVPAEAGAWTGPPLVVNGTVAASMSYSVSQLASLPSTIVRIPEPGGRTHVEQGVLLETLVNRSQPMLPGVKNALLRVIVTVRGEGRRVTFALGELDPNFGNHPALVSVMEDGAPLRSPELVVAGDTPPMARSVSHVTRLPGA